MTRFKESIVLASAPVDASTSTVTRTGEPTATVAVLAGGSAVVASAVAGYSFANAANG